MGLITLTEEQIHEIKVQAESGGYLRGLAQINFLIGYDYSLEKLQGFIQNEVLKYEQETP